MHSELCGKSAESRLLLPGSHSDSQAITLALLSLPPATFPILFSLESLTGGVEQRCWHGWDKSTRSTESLRGAGSLK